MLCFSLFDGECMIRIEDLEKSFASRLLFSNVSFTLGKKERCALLGRNGSGKSTLLRMIVGDIELDKGEVITPKGYTMGYLRQHLSFSHPSIRAEVLSANTKAEPYEADALLCGLGFSPDHLTEPPEKFSGGYQLRIELAKTLLQKPDLLLLDEPTNYLDIVSIRFLERLLKHWQGECLIISHDRSFLDRVCTHCLGLHRGGIRKVEGGSDAYFSRIKEDENRQMRENENLRKQKAHLTKFVERFRYKASKAGQAQSRVKALEKLGEIEELEDETTLSFSFAEKTHPGKQIGSIKNISFKYQAPLIQDVTFDILKGDRIAIIGKNGCGKSTLLKLLSGELGPQRGHIKYSMNAEIGYFGQTNVEQMNPQWTIYDAIKLANPKLKDLEVRNIAAQMLFHKDDVHKTIEVLSGGEKARVLLGRILATECNLLLLDEPTNHLDIESVEALITALKQFRGAIVIVTHNEWILQALELEKIILCKEGMQLVHLGDYDTFLDTLGWGDDEPKKEKPKKQNSENRDALKSIRSQIRVLEKELSNREKEKDRLEKKLVELSSKEEVETVLEHSNSFEKLIAEIDSLYVSLELLYQEEEELKNSAHM